jgi:hypothetical protein
VGPNCQLGTKRVKGSSVRGRFPAVDAESGPGIDGVHRPTRPGEEGSGPGRSGPARWPGPTGLKSKEKIFSE